MTFKVDWYGSAARTISRVVRTGLWSSAGFGFLGLGLVGLRGPTLAEAQDVSGHYTIQDLGLVGANFNQPGQPFVISNTGWVSGGAGVGSAEHAALWHEGSITDIGDPGLGGNSIAFGVDEWGHAVGEAEDAAPNLSTKEDFCGFQFMGYTTSPTPCVPFLWDQGKMVRLRTLGGVNGVANQINSYGVVAGYAENTMPDSGCPAPQKYQFKPVVWYGDWILPLQTVGNDLEGVAFSVNDWGQVVGTSGTCAAFNPGFLFNLQPVHAVLWQNGKAHDLGGLPGESNYMAHGINNLGEVVGGSASEAFFWTAESGMRGLGAVGSDIYSIALGINDKSQIVGLSLEADGVTFRAFVRQDGKLVDLNTLVAGDNPFPVNGPGTGLATACSINAKGEIIGIAIDATGATHAYLAKPTR